MPKTIVEIYKEYKIMPLLEMHMLRVTAVASLMCDSLSVLVDKEKVVAACLLHDMGNIIKSNLNYFPEFLKKEGIEYWQKVKDEYIQKYGPDETKANILIAEELKQSALLPILRCVGFRKSCINLASENWEGKVAMYADQRVAPMGVVSLADRLIEGGRRYKGRVSDMDEDYEEHKKCLEQLEEQIFSKCKIKPEDITDEAVASIIEELRNFVLK